MKRIIVGSTLAAVLAGMVAVPSTALSESSRTTVTETTTGPTGSMTIVSQEQRTFRIGSEPKVYVAPSTVDLAGLSGQDVRVVVGPSGQVSGVTRVEKTETHVIDD